MHSGGGHFTAMANVFHRRAADHATVAARNDVRAFHEDDALKARRQALERAMGSDASSPSMPPTPSSPSLMDLSPSMRDPRPWEIEALKSEERRAEEVVTDLSFQVDTLQRQLDQKNEAHERELIQVTGALEGSLSALRRLTNEIVRTIDDGIDMLQRSA